MKVLSWLLGKMMSRIHFSFFFFCSQDSRSLAGTEDKETFLVTLTKPCLYVQQVAFDKGENIKMIEVTFTQR